jgi:Protein of unknown function (DUF3667)
MRSDTEVSLLPDSNQCLNCNATLTQDAKFCSNCGQSTTPSGKPFLSFIGQSIHELLEIDGRLALTLKTLLFKPGLASYEISRGKRVKYTPAMRVYLVSSLLFFVVFASFQNIYTADTGQHSSTVEIYSRTMFLLFPLYALFINCFYRKTYYLSNLVFSMHIHSIFYLVLMIIGPLESIESKSKYLVIVQLIPAIYAVWYLVTAFKVMYRESWLKTIFKVMGVYFIYMATLGVVFDYILS